MTGSRLSTRDTIREVAGEMFPRAGYAATSVRAIARRAGIDAALVVRYFGSKEGLFLEAVAAQIDRSPFFGGPIETLGRRVVRFVLDADDEVRGVFLALVRASESRDVGARLQEFHEATFVAPLRERLRGPNIELRIRLASSLVGGLLYELWILGDEDLAAMAVDDIVTEYGALLQRLITPGD
ncbi:TetR family transcriptional regulator [Microbacterium sp. 18062]|uniref:TetR/AcrR family transcriptional regulator n=1 Tax=Microbacterium sp. 18062 TaxID=2681410 RepID=UPI00190F4138|nr:TetR family transcriptional regulator [Microbacterium sp. 18062]